MVPYDPGRWHDAYVMLGSAAAALTGLVFVGLSIHLKAIAGNRFQLWRGHYLTFGLIYLTVVSALVMIPGQGDTALGIELLIGGVVASIVVGAPLVRMTPLLPLTWGFKTRVVAVVVALTLNFIAGASLIARRGGGLYFLIAALLLALMTNVSAAWSLLVSLASE